MTINGIDISQYMPDPHTIQGTWAIVGLVILAVILAALALRVFAPAKATPTLPAADAADNNLVATTGEA